MKTWPKIEYSPPSLAGAFTMKIDRTDEFNYVRSLHRERESPAPVYEDRALCRPCFNLWRDSIGGDE